MPTHVEPFKYILCVYKHWWWWWGVGAVAGGGGWWRGDYKLTIDCHSWWVTIYYIKYYTWIQNELWPNTYFFRSTHNKRCVILIDRASYEYTFQISLTRNEYIQCIDLLILFVGDDHSYAWMWFLLWKEMSYSANKPPPALPFICARVFSLPFFFPVELDKFIVEVR